MRLAAYTDYTYQLVGGRAYADRAFALFLARIAESTDRLVVVGRVDPSSERARYPLGDEVEFVPLPWYESVVQFRRALPAMAASLRRFWRVLGGVDCVWLLGPHPVAIAFAFVALARRRRVVLGVRQDTVAYVRSRHPDRPALALAGRAMDAVFGALARICPVIAVGPEVAHRYRHARAVLEISVSLIEESDLVPPEAAARRTYEGELRVLSVGRLEAEKNPLLLAEILAALSERDEHWRLIVCGEGPMRDQLAARLSELGVADRAELRGYVSHGEGLFDLYRDAHALLHVSWTEGFPQILLEAFAAGTPVVATDVGGVVPAAGEAVVAVPPGDRQAAADALRAVTREPELRRRLIAAGNAYASTRTTTDEIRRVVAFLREHG